MFKILLSVLFVLSALPASAQSSDEAYLIKGSFGEFIQGPRAGLYFEQLSAKNPKSVVSSPACANTKVVVGQAKPIGMTDRLYYATHINYTGSRCVANCNPRVGEGVPTFCLDQTQADGTHLYQCELVYHGRDEKPEEMKEFNTCLKNAWNRD